MAYEMSVDILEDHIHIRLRGQDSIVAVREYWTHAKELLGSNPQRRLLMEEDLEGPMPDRDIHEWSEFMRSLHLPLETKIAFTFRTERASEYRFAETLLLNRGFNARIFETLPEAKAWLLEGAAV